MKNKIDKDGILEKKLSGINLELKDVIETVVEGYRIESLRFVGNELSESDLLGLHIDDGYSKEILINTEQTTDGKRYTVIHEFYHALFKRIGLKQDERDVDFLAKKKFRELYYDPKKRRIE